ncbi:porin [Vibrio hepatarius]|uniref:porin n=1 Tax=Vibrio hepatarius TaxID=171383 RepID=UPI0037350E98
MKKTVLAVALSLVAGSAIAADVNQDVSERARESIIDLILSGEEFSVGGQVAVGGYYAEGPERVGQKDEFYNGGVTGFDLFINYQKGNVLGQFAGEFDLADNYSSMDASFAVIDTWVGYKTGFGVASIGYAADSALDAVDGAADLTVEFGASASDASDVNQVVKFEGIKEGFKYGVSYYGDRQANAKGQKGFNGYVGFQNDSFQVNAGYENNDEDNSEKDQTEQIMLVNGVAYFGDFAVGANLAQHENFAGQDSLLVSTSVGYTMDKVYLAAGYANQEAYVSSEADTEWVNFGATYQITKKTSALVDFKVDLTDDNGSDDLEAFFKLAYDF